MLGAGTFINPLIKIVTTVAILAAVYVFIVKPTLDTTNSAFDSFNSTFDGFDNLPGQVQTQIDDALGDSSIKGNLQDCIQRAIDAGADQQRVSRCVERYSSS